jgi:hypothetical protein
VERGLDRRRVRVVSPIRGCEFLRGFEKMAVAQSRFAALAMAPVVIEPV